MTERITENGKQLTDEEIEEIEKDEKKKFVETKGRGKIVLKKLNG